MSAAYRSTLQSTLRPSAVLIKIIRFMQAVVVMGLQKGCQDVFMEMVTITMWPNVSTYTRSSVLEAQEHTIAEMYEELRRIRAEQKKASSSLPDRPPIVEVETAHKLEPSTSHTRTALRRALGFGSDPRSVGVHVSHGQW